METLASSSSGFGIHYGLAQCGRNAVAASDDAQPHAFFDTVRGLYQQVFVQKAKDRVHLRGWPFPIGGRERKERERADSDARRCFDDTSRGFSAGPVASGAGQSP